MSPVPPFGDVSAQVAAYVNVSVVAEIMKTTPHTLGLVGAVEMMQGQLLSMHK